MLICPVSHICDGKKKSLPHVLRTSFLAHKISTLKIANVQKFRNIQQLLGRGLNVKLRMMSLRCCDNVAALWYVQTETVISNITYFYRFAN